MNKDYSFLDVYKVKNTFVFIREVFYSVQGEGLEIGKPTIFVRFSGCPNRCSYCDEPASLNINNGKEMSLLELIYLIEKYRDSNNCRNVEITGGSPEFQMKSLKYLILSLMKLSYRISIQLSGTLDVDELMSSSIIKSNVKFKVDYKFESNMKFVISLDDLSLKDEIKLVCDIDNPDHIRRLNEFLFIYNSKYGVMNESMYPSVIITPVTDKNINILNEIDKCKKLTTFILMVLKGHDVSNIHILPRLQVLYWKNEEGK